MLNQITPPILAVLSVIGIIIFFIKKNPEIKRLEKEIRLTKEHEAGIFSGKSGRFSENGSKLKNIFLVFLEKTVKRSRIIFLRLENKLKNWGEGIRKKRNPLSEKNFENEGLLQEDYLGKKILHKEKGTDILDGISDNPEKHDPKKMNVRERLELRQKEKQEELEEKFFRPIISDRVVVPKRRRETKSRLEELLIERIAANPKDIEAYERLGEYYLEVKNLEHSKECFKQVLRLNPTNRNARYKIRKLEKILGS